MLCDLFVTFFIMVYCVFKLKQIDDVVSLVGDFCKWSFGFKMDITSCCSIMLFQYFTSAWRKSEIAYNQDTNMVGDCFLHFALDYSFCAIYGHF